MHLSRMKLFLKTTDEVHAAFQHRVKREHLWVICLISVLVWSHPLFRSLLGLDVTWSRGRARACPPLCAHAAHVKGTGKVRGTFRDRVSFCVYAHKHRGRLVCRSSCGVGASAPVQMCAHMHADVD